eukprot:1513003-Pleurochrysis_carterae.AAC.2
MSARDLSARVRPSASLPSLCAFKHSPFGTSRPRCPQQSSAAVFHLSWRSGIFLLRSRLLALKR